MTFLGIVKEVNEEMKGNMKETTDDNSIIYKVKIMGRTSTFFKNNWPTKIIIIRKHGRRS